MIVLSISIGFFIWLIHRTSMIESYSTVFGIKKLLRIYDYQQWCADNFGQQYVDYPHFIREKVKGSKIIDFLTHLFVCPYCSITMLSLIVSIIRGEIFTFLFVAAIATLFFLILDFFYKKNR